MEEMTPEEMREYDAHLDEQIRWAELETEWHDIEREESDGTTEDA